MCFSFFDTLSLVTPLSLLINLSFLKPLSIVFQDRIWSVCFNVVVCARIQRRRKKRIEKKKKKKKWRRKGKCQKEENKKGSHQILRSEMEGRSTVLKKKSWKKKIVEWKFQKRLTFRQILKTLLIIHLYPFLFHSLCFYPTLRPNKILIWSWRLCSSDIDMTEKKKV